MDSFDIASYRLAAQRIAASSFRNPEDVVSFMGALQAQDYNASLWAIGLRLKDATKSDVDEAIEKGSIVRTWPMRHTLHFVSPNDVKWMLDLYRDEKIPKYQQRNGLTEEILLKGEKIIANSFKSKRKVTSKEIYSNMARSGIPELKKHEVQSHILRRAGREGIVCYASHNGKQPTFALLNDWIGERRAVTAEKALAELALRYFTSHGPATMKDYLWWSGIRASEARIGIEKSLPKLSKKEIGGKVYYMPRRMPRVKADSRIHLLPAFDEYLISYSDRSAMLANEDTRKMLDSGKMFFAHGYGIFLPVIIAGGQVIGTWKRINVKPGVEVEIKPFIRLDKEHVDGIKDAVENYGNFLETKASLKR